MVPSMVNPTPARVTVLGYRGADRVVSAPPEVALCARCEGPDLYEVPLVVVCLDRVVRAYGDAFDIATLLRDETPPIPDPDVPTGALFCRDCGGFFGWVA